MYDSMTYLTVPVSHPEPNVPHSHEVLSNTFLRTMPVLFHKSTSRSALGALKAFLPMTFHDGDDVVDDDVRKRVEFQSH